MSNRKPQKRYDSCTSPSPSKCSSRETDSSFGTIDLSYRHGPISQNGKPDYEEEKSVVEAVVGRIKAANAKFWEWDVEITRKMNLGLNVSARGPSDEELEEKRLREEEKRVMELGLEVGEELVVDDVVIARNSGGGGPSGSGSVRGERRGRGQDQGTGGGSGTRRSISSAPGSISLSSTMQIATPMQSSFHVPKPPPQQTRPPTTTTPPIGALQRFTTYLFPPPAKTVRAIFYYEPPQTEGRYRPFVTGAKEELWFHHPESWQRRLKAEELEMGVDWRQNLDKLLNELGREPDGEQKLLLVVLISSVFPDDKEGFWKLLREIARSLIFDKREDGVTQFVMSVCNVTARDTGYFSTKKDINWFNDSAFCRFTDGGKAQWMQFYWGYEVCLHAELELKKEMRLGRIG